MQSFVVLLGCESVDRSTLYFAWSVLNGSALLHWLIKFQFRSHVSTVWPITWGFLNEKSRNVIMFVCVMLLNYGIHINHFVNNLFKQGNIEFVLLLIQHGLFFVLVLHWIWFYVVTTSYTNIFTIWNTVLMIFIYY